MAITPHFNPPAADGADNSKFMQLSGTQVIYTDATLRDQAFNAQTGATYTLAASDIGKMVTLDNAGAITLSVPQDSDVAWPVGARADLMQLGAGQVTVAAGTGATLRVSGLTAKARAQYSRLLVQKIAANTWVVSGDVAAA